MENLLDINLAIDETRKFTNEQLLAIRKNMNNAIYRRMNRRQYIMDRNITRVMEKYISNALEELGLSEILGNNIYCYYCPRFTDTNYKQKQITDPMLANYVDRIGFSFDYGETYIGPRYIGDDQVTTMEPRYRIQIKPGKISIVAPVHHVKPLPYNRAENFSGNISNSVQIKWHWVSNVPKKQQCGIPNYIIKSKLTTSKERNLIYTDVLLKAVVNLLITNGHADLMLRKCQNLYEIYNKHFITSAQSSTLYFLLIGRFQQKAIHHSFVPMDVIRYIAKIIWESRYENNVWGNDGSKRFDVIVPPEETNLSIDEDHFQEDDDNAPHGWKPWYRIRDHREIYKL